MRRRFAPTPLPCLIVMAMVVLLAGCSEPPQKEIDQAAAAVDFAGKAGADKYAAEEYAAAVSGLRKARASVEERDYRQALSYAIDARQRAQNAIGEAGEGKARAQRSTDALVAEVTDRITQLLAGLQAAQTARVPVKELRPTQAAAAAAQRALQEARTLIGAENHDQAGEILSSVRKNIEDAVRKLEELVRRAPRKKR
ncbi:MAG: DUF4398 domain-containing protein [Vicinamibacterales bacterium]